MVDLGKYALPVLASYAATFVLLGLLVGFTLWRGARMRRALGLAETGAGTGAGTGAEAGAGTGAEAGQNA